jgi:Tol biopolymer transport system component
MARLVGALGIVLLVGGCAASPPSTAGTSPRGTPVDESDDPSPPANAAIDGLPIALVSDSEGGAGIYLAGPAGDRERLSPTSAPVVVDFAPVWSPSGDRIAHQRIEADGTAAIYVADPATGDQRKVAVIGPPSTTDSRVSWSPDGARLAYWSTGGADNEIQVVTVSDEAQSTVSAHPGADRYPAWSPSGDLLAFWSDRSGHGAIWVVSADGSGLHQLVEVGAAYGPVAWAPDGNRLAVPVEKPGPEWLIRIVDLEGNSEAELDHEGSALGAAWSPDGGRLAYVQLIGPARQLWVADSVGGDATPIGPPAAIGRASTVSHVADRWPSPPSWSPTGDAIVTEWPRADGVEVIVVDVDSDSWVSLTPSEANDGSPAWRPDPRP